MAHYRKSSISFFQETFASTEEKKNRKEDLVLGESYMRGWNFPNIS